MPPAKVSLEELLDRASKSEARLECEAWRNDRDILVVEFHDMRSGDLHPFVIIDNVATPIDAQSEDY